jgi:hypothetical protein
MDMIGHQTPAQHPYPRLFAMILHQMQVRLAIRLRKKDIRAIHAPLGYVVGDFREDASWISRHDSVVSRSVRLSRKMCQSALALSRRPKRCKFRLTRFPLV